MHTEGRCHAPCGPCTGRSCLSAGVSQAVGPRFRPWIRDRSRWGRRQKTRPHRGEVKERHVSFHAYIPIKATVAPIKATVASHPGCLCVSGTKGASLCMMPECPPIQVPNWAPEAVPVACVGSVDLTGGKLQDLLGGPAPGVWVGLDMKQLRGQAEVGVLGGRGNVDLELGWGGEPVCTCLGAS